VLAVEVAVSWVTLTTKTRLSSHGESSIPCHPKLRRFESAANSILIASSLPSSIRARQKIKAEALQARVAQLLWRHQGEEDAPGGARRTGGTYALPLDPMNRSAG